MTEPAHEPASGPAFAVLDVGGTSIKVGAVHGDRVVIRPSVDARSTAASEVVLTQLGKAARTAMACAIELSPTVAGLAIAFPGPFDLDRGRALLAAPGKFHSIHGLDLRAELPVAAGLSDDLPIGFARDSEAVGVGEALHGAGQGHQRVLTVALGTGVGTALTHDGVPRRHVGEVEIESLFSRQTSQGSIDDVLSARGLAATLGVAPSDLASTLERAATAQAGIDQYADRLGSFLASLGSLRADIIVIAGGVAESFDLFRDRIAAHLQTPVVPARLGADAALLGAVRLAFPPPLT